MANGGRVAAKVALVTGASSGIGKATALLLAREGAAVGVADINAQAGEMVAEEIRRNDGKALFLPLNVTDEEAWQQSIHHLESFFGKMSILVNNAGISAAGAVADLSLAEWRRVLQVNLDGVFLGTKHAIRTMRSGNGGSIVNVASASGIKAGAGASAYCSSKAAVRMFSKTAALECAAAGWKIRVNVVSPGGVKTPLWKTMDFWPGLVAQHGDEEAAWKALAGPDSEGFFSAQDIAQAILFLTSDESSYWNAGEMVIDRGYTA